MVYMFFPVIVSIITPIVAKKDTESSKSIMAVQFFLDLTLALSSYQYTRVHTLANSAELTSY